ncbi:MAG: AbrB/MazE/SpoVT family DNA-binding domain-containing protein [Ruminococcaceae bacterium]|nr:AbrB/MazE/SpoVT family DNA-binding domain-containing protein [Oscillospiraceae bacterium]
MKKAKLDTQGRIVIPKPFRAELNIVEGAPLMITCEGGAVIVRPDKSTCALCGSHMKSDNKMRLCDKCIKDVLEYCGVQNKK